MIDVIYVETMTGAELEEMYWESLMGDSALMGALPGEASRFRKPIRTSDGDFNIRSTENDVQDEPKKRAYGTAGDTR